MVDYPKDWERISIGEIFKVTRGLVLSTDKMKKSKSSIYKYPVYSSQTLNNGLLGYYKKYLFEDAITWTTDGANAGDTNFRKGRFFCTNVCGVLINEEGYANYCIAAIINSISKDYVSYVGNPKLMNNVVKKINIEVPPLIEQKAIAETLMTFDEHLGKLERLINKKKMVRDGAVEDLMTGKTRLDGFDGEWKKFKLEDICKEKGMVRGPFGGSLKKEYFVKKGYKVYEQRNAIYKSVDIGNYYIDVNKFEELKRFEIKEDDFIISCSGTIGEIYRIPKKFKKGIINQALLKLSIDTNLCDLNFFNIYFSWDRFKTRIIDDTQGGAMKNLVGMDKFRQTSLVIPTDIQEQKAIADILASMDEEIENLEKEKAKVEKIKAGAMEDLLTGRIRLI